MAILILNASSTSVHLHIFIGITIISFWSFCIYFFNFYNEKESGRDANYCIDLIDKSMLEVKKTRCTKCFLKFELFLENNKLIRDRQILLYIR